MARAEHCISPDNSGRERHLEMLEESLPLEPGETVEVKGGSVVNLTEDYLGDAELIEVELDPDEVLKLETA